MGWKITKGSAKFAERLGADAQRKWDAFQNAIHHKSMHPKVAAALIGDSNYKCLNIKIDQYQIKLGYADRATFTLDESAQTVKVLQVGGHT